MQTTTKIATRLTVTVAAALLMLVAPAIADAAAQAPSPKAAPLARYAGYGLPDGSQRVRTLQRRLHAAGERPGPVDGRFGPLTEAAVLGFQTRQGLAADGIVGPKTQAALRRAAKLLAPGAGYGARHGSERVRRLQRSLERLGQHPGPVDGRFGPMTEAAVVRFQRHHGLTTDGVVGPATTTGLKRQLARATRAASDRSSSRVSSDRSRSRNQDHNRSARGGASHAPVRDTGPATGSHGSGSELGPARILVIGIGIVLLGAALAVTLASLRPTRRPRTNEPESAALHAVGGPAEEPVRAWPGRARETAGRPSMLGYASVAADARGGDRQELRTQLQAILLECRQRGFELVDIVREREPDKGRGLNRPGLGYALKQITDGEASGIVVADLSRLGRSITDLGEVLECFSRTEARLVVANTGLDTADESGALAARTLIDVSTWERERLSDRTRKGLEAARRSGRRASRAGVADYPELRERIAAMRTEGMTLQAIADRLNEEAVPTIRGGALWRPSSVQAAVGYRRPRRSDPWSPAEARERAGNSWEKEEAS